jgi:hypothetical protein
MKAVIKIMQGQLCEYGIILSEREIFWAGCRINKQARWMLGRMVYSHRYIQEMLKNKTWEEIE